MTEHLDVLIIGAGVSGISAAYHLKTLAPQKRFAIVESRSAIGGTWDLFRYPGIRSDSDMSTFGFSFHPWKSNRTFADGPSIKAYLEETAEAYGLQSRIRFRQRVVQLNWSTEKGVWRVTIETEAGTHELTASVVFACSGYYSYERGYTPSWPGTDDFEGLVIHPQQWPESLDYAGKRIVVIGSGATAVTLVPALAKHAAHVTMLQRSPSWIVSQPLHDRVAGWLQERLSPRVAHRITRAKNIARSIVYYELARRLPGRFGDALKARVRAELEPDVPVSPHFEPTYAPWDQRLCLAPDGDLFTTLKTSRASVVTDHIDRFTADGILLRSGQQLAADIVVTATGLRIRLLEGVAFLIDGERVDLSERLTYKGCMCSGVPNLVLALGYTNASWTLKVDLTAAWVARLLNYMDDHNVSVVVPKHDPAQEKEPVINFSSGYVRRALDLIPKQGTERPWRLHQNYLLDLLEFRYRPLNDGTLIFSAPGEQR